MILLNRNHLADLHHIACRSYCWNGIISFCSNGHAPLTVMTHSYSSKPRTAQIMILSLVSMTRLEKMFHNICIFAMAISLRWASRGPWSSCPNESRESLQTTSTSYSLLTITFNSSLPTLIITSYGLMLSDSIKFPRLISISPALQRPWLMNTDDIISSYYCFF